jgi:hypothetical protein
MKPQNTPPTRSFLMFTQKLIQNYNTLKQNETFTTLAIQNPLQSTQPKTKKCLNLVITQHN